LFVQTSDWHFTFCPWSTEFRFLSSSSSASGRRGGVWAFLSADDWRDTLVQLVNNK